MNIPDAIVESMRLLQSANPSKRREYSISFEDDRKSAPDFLAYSDEFLKEVFTNIFSNSVRYTEENKVRIEIRLAHDSENSIPYCKVAISDSGKGIPPDIREKLFSRYLEVARGSGLGLAIVYALVVERYNGKIKIEDNSNSKGAKVIIWLPILEQKAKI